MLQISFYRYFLPFFVSVLLCPAFLYASQSIISPLASSSLLLDIAGEGKNLVAVGERGHVLLSGDKGNSWKQVAVPVDVLLTSVIYQDGEIWTAGHESVIMQSTDFGETWRVRYHKPERDEPLFDILFLDKSNGFAVGAYGLMLRTRDGGETWKQLSVEKDDSHLYSIIAGERGTLFIAGESGALYKSSDFGNTWKKLSSPYQGSFFGILTSSKNRTYLFGQRGKLFVSDSNGELWTERETRTRESLQGGLSLENGNVYIVGNSGTILLTDGINVLSVSSPHGETMSGIYQADLKSFLLLGQKGISRPMPLPIKIQ